MESLNLNINAKYNIRQTVTLHNLKSPEHVSKKYSSYGSGIKGACN